jgi:photosystem II stability/assembly factor-like uncharacterized protein
MSHLSCLPHLVYIYNVMKKYMLRKYQFSFLFVLFLSCSVYAQWMQLPQDTNNINCSVFFINPDTGFIAGDYAYANTYIQRTTDGGQNWDSTLITSGPMAMSIYFPDDTTGYCGGQGGAVYKTINMGQTWIFAGNVAPQDNFGTMYFVNKDTGFVADFEGRIFRTTNGAINWIMVSANQNSFENFYPGTGKFQFINDSAGFLANGNYGIVMKTADYGTTWTYIDLPSANTWAMSIYMFNKDTGMVVAENGKVWKTSNGGNSWTGPQVIAGGYDLMDITFFNDSIGYVVGGENSNYVYHAPAYPPVGAKIYVTANRGITWSVDTSLCCDWFTSICNAGNNVGYAAGWHGWLFKISNALSLTGIDENKTTATIKIYPNPVSDVLYFSSAAHVELRDMTSRIILSAENKNELNVADVADGMYLLWIQTKDDFYSQKIIVRH